MGTDQGEFLRVEAAGLEQHAVGDRHLADVVERGRQVDAAAQVVVEPQGLGHDLAVAGDAPGVVAGVVVPVFHRQREAEDDLGLALAQGAHRPLDLAGEPRGLVVEAAHRGGQPHQVAQPDPELDAADALVEEVGGTGVQGGEAHRIAHLAGDHHDRDLGVVLDPPQVTDDGRAVHLGHVVVDQHEVEGAHPRLVEREERVPEDGGDRLLVLFQQPLNLGQDRLAVVDDEYVHLPISSPAAHDVRPSAGVRGMGSRKASRSRKPGCGF